MEYEADVKRLDQDALGQPVDPTMDLERQSMGLDESEPKDLSSKLSRQMACEAAHIRKHLNQPAS